VLDEPPIMNTSIVVRTPVRNIICHDVQCTTAQHEPPIMHTASVFRTPIRNTTCHDVQCTTAQHTCIEIVLPTDDKDKLNADIQYLIDQNYYTRKAIKGKKVPLEMYSCLGC
jgi:hypothetical protein